MRNLAVCSVFLWTLFAAAPAAKGSDPVGIYALVEKVVLEPNPEAPERIQVWGVFALAKAGSRNDYEPPQRGYFYYSLPAGREAARKEWADLKRVAGTKQGVAFGRRFFDNGRVRKASDRPSSPDLYELHIGIQRIRSDTDHPVIRSLLDHKG